VFEVRGRGKEMEEWEGGRRGGEEMQKWGCVKCEVRM